MSNLFYKVYFEVKKYLLLIFSFIELLFCFLFKPIYKKQNYINNRNKIKNNIRTLQTKQFTSSYEEKEYLDYILNQQLDKSNFVELSDKHYIFDDNDVKLIAFYLPQFHSFKENVKWFGRGFTEWSNTSKTLPQWKGHWQPHIPIDVGYYTLEDNLAMKRQVELAKQYGIYGFCYYYYWFSGNKIMEKPINNMLMDKSIDMPFFFFWADEDWTKLWGDGQHKEVLFKQELKDGDEEKFMNDILPFFKDERYIKINNKPLLIIYKTEIIPEKRFIEFTGNLKKIAKENGFDGIEILSVSDVNEKADMEKIKKYNLDGIFEFLPCNMQGILEKRKEQIVNEKFVGSSFDIKKYIDEKLEPEDKKYDYRLFKNCFPNWDNTARKCYNGAAIMQNDPIHYKKWLKNIIKWTKKNRKKEEQFVFINAWNEWAEGAHLEPDQKYGYAFLQATKEALEEEK